MRRDELKTFYTHQTLSKNEDDSYFLTRLSNIWGEDCLSSYQEDIENKVKTIKTGDR